MRTIRIYDFDVKKTIKFYELPGIVHKFLDKEGLTNGQFLYCLEMIDEAANARRNLERLKSKGESELADKMLLEPFYKKVLSENYLSPCERAVKDCPKLGSVKRLPSPKETNMYDLLQVSNIIVDTDCSEDDIIPFFKRYDRTYGIMDINFFYYDVNFFGNVHPFLRDRSELNPNLFLESDCPKLANQIFGSGICIYKTAVGNIGLELSIDTLHNGLLFDPDPYYKSMCALLPGAKCKTRLRVFLAEDEKAEINILSVQAKPVLEECREYLEEKLQSKGRETLAGSKYNIATLLKKLANKAGYSYLYKPNGVFILTKSLPRGHYLKCAFISAPFHYYISFSLTLEGLGFSHCLLNVRETPINQEELDAWLIQVFDVLTGFEKKYTASIDMLYKPTPVWFKDME